MYKDQEIVTIAGTQAQAHGTRLGTTGLDS